MTETTQATSLPDATSSLTDPERLARHDDVTVVEETAEHDDPDHFAPTEDWAGVAIVGVTDDDGRTLLTINDDDGTIILPYTPVDPGEDYVETLQSAVEAQTGLAVEVDEVRLVRRNEHRLTTDDDRESTTYDVVFEASPVPGATLSDDAPLRYPVCGEPVEDDGYRMDWVDELPDVDDEMCDTVRGDVQLFVE